MSASATQGGHNQAKSPLSKANYSPKLKFQNDSTT